MVYQTFYNKLAKHAVMQHRPCILVYKKCRTSTTNSVTKMDRSSRKFSTGPLDSYRNLASFNWTGMKSILYRPDTIEFEDRLYKELPNFPNLAVQFEKTHTFDEQRQITARKLNDLKTIEKKYKEEFTDNGEKLFIYTLITFGADSTAGIKKMASVGMFSNTIRLLGTETHEHLLEKVQTNEILGCFGLTEVGHGSDTKNMRTVATYDIESESFILNSPDFQAAKCWIGALAQSSTHIAVFANLITPDGVNHGLHNFIAPLRDTKTFKPFPGVTLFDVGEKAGLNGFDNGGVIFNNYKIPRKNLLNKVADVTKEGLYVTNLPPLERVALTLKELTYGRLILSGVTNFLLTKAITISVRYAAVRKQFAIKDGGEEVALLEHEMHQHRLFPYLAATYAFNMFSTTMFEVYVNDHLLNGESRKDTGLQEVFAIVSAAKSMCSWTARDGIQESREACGANGYLKAAGLGDLRNENDALITGEGENQVLIQQASKWLLKIWPAVLKKRVLKTPLNSIDFLNRAEDILGSKCTATTIEDVANAEYILETYKYLVCYLLNTCHVSESEETSFNCHPVLKKELSIVYIQHFILQNMHKKILVVKDKAIKDVLQKLFALYGLYNLQKHTPHLYAGGFATQPTTAKYIQNSIFKLCRDLKRDAVALVDCIAPDDCIMHSILGYSDGQIYKRLEEKLLNSTDVNSIPSWWKEILYGEDQDDDSVKSKI